MKRNKVKIFKIITTMLAVFTIIAIIVYVFPLIKDLSTVEGQLAFKDKIQNSGLYGILLLFALQFTQIFLFIIPGEPIEILAGICYGGFWGTVFILVSNIIISLFIILSVRKLGKKFAYSFYDEEKIKKIENSKLFKNPQKIELIMAILFFIPGTPKDLLVYVAGLLPIKTYRFILISTIARIPSIVTSTLAGSRIMAGDWKMSIILYLGISVIVAIIVFVFNKFDKDKITKNAIDIIK